MASRAGLAAPAVAVAGALVASPVSHVLAATSPSLHLAMADQGGKRPPGRSAASSRSSEDGLSGTALPGNSLASAARRHQHASRLVSQRHARQAGRQPASGKRAAPDALTCSGSSYFLPANYQTIVSFLLAHGYSKLGAAGIAGNIFQESKGDPESVGMGGGGLIGFTPLPAGYVTGNPVADLQTQLYAILSYDQQWAQYIPALNAASTPTEAADIYMNYFERPGIPAAANREAAANAVAQACHL